MNTFIKVINGFKFVLIIMISCLAACENNISEVNSITSTSLKSIPIESGKNVEVLYSDSARVRAKLVAAVLNRFEGKKPYMELPKGMLLVFYDKNKKEQTRLTADYGLAFDNGNGIEQMEAKRNVVVINEKGDQLNTEHLTWNAVTKKIYTNEFVKITTKDEIIWGDGLEANQDFSKYEIKNVKGQISVKDSIK